MATAQVLPKELRLSAPPTMPQARSYMFKQQSQNASYDPTSGATVQINIPRLQRSYLTKDSYLKFRIKIDNFTIGTSAQGLFLDCPGAFGFINKIEIYDYLGSTLLESTSGHGELVATLMDISSNPSELGFHYNATAGTHNGGILADENVGVTAATKYSQYGSTCGQLLSSTTISSAKYWEFAIPLFSFLGTLSNKFVPLHNGFTIVLTLNTAPKVMGDAVAAGTSPSTFPTTYTMSDIYMCCQILELGPVAESMLLNSAGGKPLVIPAKAFRNYNSSISAGVSNFKVDLNLNVASLTNLLWIMREDTYCNVAANQHLYKVLSNRIRNTLQSWYFQYGSSILPQTSGISTSSPTGATIENGGHDECYLELMKSRHGMNQATFDTSITRKSYIIDAGTAAIAALSGASVTQHGRFAAGLDLELVSGRSQNLICGMNTNGMNTAIYGTFGTPASVVACRIDVWAEYDAFINISPGIATTVSF